METIINHKQEIVQKGYTIIDKVYSIKEVAYILDIIDKLDTSKPTFRKTNDLFTIRRFLKEAPALLPYIFTNRLNSIINQLFGEGYFAVKSIYFDKSGESNWFVSYHQDLTISVDRKVTIEGFGPWTVKQYQYAVQPPLDILKSNFTIRIHLDDTNELNGALRVVSGSHLKGIVRPETIDLNTGKEKVCMVPKGGIMIMKPLLVHASSRTTNNQKRRVIHLEFSNKELPEPLKWSERM